MSGEHEALSAEDLHRLTERFESERDDSPARRLLAEHAALKTELADVLAERDAMQSLATQTGRERDRLAAEVAELQRGKLWELHPLNMYEGSMRERACGDGRVSAREVLYALGYSAESRKERDEARAERDRLAAEVERLRGALSAAYRARVQALCDAIDVGECGAEELWAARNALLADHPDAIAAIRAHLAGAAVPQEPDAMTLIDQAAEEDCPGHLLLVIKEQRGLIGRMHRGLANAWRLGWIAAEDALGVQFAGERLGNPYE